MRPSIRPREKEVARIDEKTPGMSALVVEDVEALRRFMAGAMEKAGFRTEQAATAREARAFLKDGCFDIVLLDLKLGQESGLDILKLIRRQDPGLPVIIVTSCAELNDKIAGFDSGCDDYVTKPFYSQELVSRARRLVVRSGRAPGEAITILESIEAGPFVLDLRSSQATKEGVPLPMRKKLFDLFHILARNEGRVVAKEALLEALWERPEDSSENSLYVHIRQLRSLIEEDPDDPRHIVTARGIGFKFVAR